MSSNKLLADHEPDTVDVDVIRHVADELHLSQAVVTQALNETVVYAPSIGKAGPMLAERYINHPPCHVRRAAESYLVNREAMEIGDGIPNGFTLLNTYDTAKFDYPWSEQTMWSLTGVNCTITPVLPEGVLVAISANMTSERIAALGGAVATAAAVTPIMVSVEQIYMRLPLAIPLNQWMAGLIGVVIGGLAGVIFGRFWWKEESRTRARILTRAVEGIAQMAHSGPILGDTSPPALHPETGETLPPGLGETAETLGEALEAIQLQREETPHPEPDQHTKA